MGVLFVTASSTASLIARPSEPEQDGSSREACAAGVRVGARGGHDLRSPRLHHVAAVGLLVVAHPHHVDLHVDAEELPGEGEGAAPLPGARLRGEALHALLLVVEGLGHRGVRLVAARGAHALVLVEDLRRRPERLLEPSGAVERRGPPEAVDLAHGLGDLDPALLRDLLLDEGHREERREVGRPDRLLRARVEHRRQVERQVGLEVVPGLRHLGLGQDELGVVGHGSTPGRENADSTAPARPRSSRRTPRSGRCSRAG